jgi:site-specific recombinase XerD
MLQKHIEDYLSSLRVANVSPHTIKNYRHDLEVFAQFVGPETDIRDLGVPVVRGHLYRLAESGVNAVSRNRALAVFKAFGKHLFAEGLLDDNIFEVVPRAKVPSRLPSAPAVETVFKLLDGEMPTAWPARDRALLELLYGSGVRNEEAAHLELDDIRTDRLILIHGKGQKQRLVPIGGALKRALDAYLLERAARLFKLKGESQALFLGIAPRNGVEHLTTRSVGRILHDAGVAKGIEPMHPHQLRHACATPMLDNGVIQKLLGHEKLSTTALYAFVSPKLMRRTYNDAHPSAKPPGHQVARLFLALNDKL